MMAAIETGKEINLLAIPIPVWDAYSCLTPIFWRANESVDVDLGRGPKA